VDRVFQTYPCGVEAVAHGVLGTWRVRFRRTLVGLKQLESVEGTIESGFQTYPCGVEAPRTRRTKSGSRRFRRTLVGLKHATRWLYHTWRRVSDVPLWG